LSEIILRVNTFLHLQKRMAVHQKKQYHLCNTL